MSADAAAAADWRPTAAPAALRRRARLLAAVRAFFAARDVLEVDTPALSAAGATDVHLHSFAVAGDRDDVLYLHTSPEYPMKRLLAAGSGYIYQLAKVFRRGEEGRRHQREFTLLEWYRPGFDCRRLMDEVALLVTEVVGGQPFRAPPERLSYRELFERELGFDPHQATVAELAACADQRQVPMPAGMPPADPDPWRDLLLTHCLEPRLGRDRLSFVYDYPASQAALARIRPGEPPVAERFELYWNGVELANGFQELTDAAEQRRRWECDNRRRQALGLPVMPLDERLLAALAAGLPDCAGVALGFDRLVMLAAGVDSLDAVVAFPDGRA